MPIMRILGNTYSPVTKVNSIVNMHCKQTLFILLLAFVYILLDLLIYVYFLVCISSSYLFTFCFVLKIDKKDERDERDEINGMDEFIKIDKLSGKTRSTK